MGCQLATTAQQVYVEIRDGILSGRYPPGERLREEKLASALGVSRSPIREALRQLQSDGLIVFAPNRGAHVAMWSEQDVDEVLHLRSLIEGYAARLAARKLSPELLRKLTDLADEMERAGEGPTPGVDRVATLNAEFHRIIVQASDNARLVSLMNQVLGVPVEYRAYARHSQTQMARSFAHHRELVRAFETRDEEYASMMMRVHVLAARNALISESD